MLVRLRIITQAVVTEHQVVVRLQILGINGKRLFEFLYRLRVALLKKEHAAHLVANHTVTRELLKHDSQVSNRAIIIAVFLEGSRIKEIRPRKPRIDRQGFLEHFSREPSRKTAIMMARLLTCESCLSN